MTVNIHFDHTSIYLNPDLNHYPGFTAGTTTAITITMHNDGGDVTGTVSCRLYYVGPTASHPEGETVELNHILIPPNNWGFPLHFTVIAGQSGGLTVHWIPGTGMFPKSLGRSVSGYLFAQSDLDPVLPNFAGDTSAQNNWDPAYRLCARHNIDIVT